MVSVNVILPVILLVVFFMAFPLILQFSIRRRVAGRHLCAIIESDGPLSIRLLRKRKDDFVKDREDEWTLKPGLMKQVEYPIGWPKILSGFQQTVMCSLVMRGRSDPLDWKDPPRGALSSKELPAILDPHWLINLVKGVGEEGQSSKGERMLSYLAAGASVLALVTTLYLITRLGAIQQSIEALRSIAR